MRDAGERVRAAFERAPVLVERISAQIHDDEGADTVVRVAAAILSELSEREQIAILDAHPRIGAAPGTLSTLSRTEQGEEADTVTMRELGELNGAYERTFGFRFVVFVNGRSKREIVPVLRERLTRTRSEELATGIAEFLAISRDRLLRLSR